MRQLWVDDYCIPTFEDFPLHFRVFYRLKKMFPPWEHSGEKLNENEWFFPMGIFGNISQHVKNTSLMMKNQY